MFSTIGVDWLESFKQRHHLACRKPEATSLARQAGFNPTTVKRFFDKLKDVMDRYVS